MSFLCNGWLAAQYLITCGSFLWELFFIITGCRGAFTAPRLFCFIAIEYGRGGGGAMVWSPNLRTAR